jgi:hypothetical protein
VLRSYAPDDTRYSCEEDYPDNLCVYEELDAECSDGGFQDRASLGIGLL